MSNIQHNTELLLQAAVDGDAVEVQRLIPLSDPKAYGSRALQMATQNGHIECVKLLIPVSDPKANNSSALQFAVSLDHTECVDLLYPVSEPMVALQKMQQQHPDSYKLWGQLYEMIEAERLHNTLNAEVGTTTAKVQRKM